MITKDSCQKSIATIGGLFANRIIRIVLQYANAQKTDSSYTWAGVTYSLLNDRKSAADYARQVAENQREEYVDAFDQENKELHQKVDELTAKNASLEAEVRGLRRKLNNAEGTPLLVYGEEEEFFPDETKEMILEELEKRASNLSSGTRRADVLNDVLEANPVQGRSDQRRSNLRNTLTDYSKMLPSKKRQLQDLGFEIDEDGKHYSLSYYEDSRYFTTLPKSGSDWRGGRNSVSEIIQKLMQPSMARVASFQSRLDLSCLHQLSQGYSVPSIVLRKFGQPPARLLFEKRHVQVAAGAPFAVRDVLQAGAHQHEGRLSIGECADDAGTSPDLPVEPLDGVVRADAPPMLARHLAVRRRLGVPSAHNLGASLSFIDSSSVATDPALADAASRDSIAWIALSMASTWERFDLGTLASALR